MEADPITIQDLSIFENEETGSLFHKLNFTSTTGGKDALKKLLKTPLDNLQQIKDRQRTLAFLSNLLPQWPDGSTMNGTIMVMEKLYETAISLPSATDWINGFIYKITNPSDYALLTYSIQHFMHFIQDMDKIEKLIEEPDSQYLKEWKKNVRTLLSSPQIQKIINMDLNASISRSRKLSIGLYIRNRFESRSKSLIRAYGEIDSLLSLCTAKIKYHLNFPIFEVTPTPFLEIDGLFHIMLEHPVASNLQLAAGKNILFLTGANMAGKSTFIKAIGIAAYLAHLGIGVPAIRMRLSLFDGLLTNIQIKDNIIQGESFFYNEVQRVKNTISKITDGRNWLLLIDELFKGTNIRDAMKCSTTVIDGLTRIKGAVVVLSTHLYEIGEELKSYPNIQFRYFETTINGLQLQFSYQLKEGISDDHIGYLILQKEGVVDMITHLKKDGNEINLPLGNKKSHD